MHLLSWSQWFNLKIFLTALTASLALSAPLAVSAQSDDSPLKNLKEVAQRGGVPTSEIDVPTVAAIIINSVLSVVGSLLFILVIYGGFLWMTAAGNEERVAKAKKLLKNAVIGLFIILSGYIITSFIIRQVQSIGDDYIIAPTPIQITVECEGLPYPEQCTNPTCVNNTWVCE